MEFDPDRLRAIVGALGGVAVYGLVLAGSPEGAPEGVRGRVALRDLLLRLACAAPAAVILAVFFVKAALPVIPWRPLREAYLFGFIVGAFSWELLPLLFRVVKRRAEQRAEKL